MGLKSQKIIIVDSHPVEVFRNYSGALQSGVMGQEHRNRVFEPFFDADDLLGSEVLLKETKLPYSDHGDQGSGYPKDVGMGCRN